MIVRNKKTCVIGIGTIQLIPGDNTLNEKQAKQIKANARYEYYKEHNVISEVTKSKDAQPAKETPKPEIKGIDEKPESPKNATKKKAKKKNK